jgi:hypothetical protein
MPNPQRFCDFCEKPGLTKEHIWPDWLSKVLPRPEYYDQYSNWHLTGRGNFSKKDRESGLVNYPTRNIKRPGHTRSRKLRNVCRECNNGWMSRVQSAAKPRLEPLVNGGWREINPGDQKVLATWAVMFTMVLELAHPETDTHTPEQRREFSLDPKPPKNWLVWLGNARKYPLDFWHYAWRVSDGLPTDEATAKLNIQTTTFGVGEIFFHTFSHSEPIFENRTLIAPDRLALRHDVTWLWPVNSYPLRRPPRYLSDVEVHRVATSGVSIFGGYAIEPDGKAYLFESSLFEH